MTTRILLQQLLPEVVTLARTAALAVLRVYSTDFAVESKSDHSPLTAADRAAHSIIVAGLQHLAPEVPVLSEESELALHEFRNRCEWPRHWLVDPAKAREDEDRERFLREARLAPG